MVIFFKHALGRVVHSETIVNDLLARGMELVSKLEEILDMFCGYCYIKQGLKLGINLSSAPNVIRVFKP